MVYINFGRRRPRRYVGYGRYPRGYGGYQRGYGGGGGGCLRDLLLINTGCCLAEAMGCGPELVLLAPSAGRLVHRPPADRSRGGVRCSGSWSRGTASGIPAPIPRRGSPSLMTCSWRGRR